MMDREIVNARITSTRLGYEDHGILTGMLMLDYGWGGQGFGGYALDRRPPQDAEGRRSGSRRPSLACGLWIARVLKVVGVENWEDLPGKYVRVDHEHGKIHRIGNVLHDNWFDPGAELKALSEQEVED
jgi:hypothetical protein